ncbi:MAG: hypothetical protein K9N51_06825 [Candidatus Pacebacteria bacterium]|nr:hypothetical protein [Candidatus Paceibacterota bacterium]
MRNLFKIIFLVFVVVWFGYEWWRNRPVVHGPGVVAPEAPEQVMIEEEVSPIVFGDYRLTPLASFQVEARVLSRERYWFGREARLAPVDLALGWGRMSDESVLKSIDISQSNRFYRWHVKQFPIPRRDIESSSCNMHLIPANGVIARRIKRVRVGQVVRFKGSLVEIESSNGWRWKSSLSRGDTGAGACEIVYVTDFSEGEDDY